MDFRKSFSKLFKKLKGKFPGGNRKRDGRSGDEASRKNTHLHSEVDIKGAVGGGHGQEGVDADGGGATQVDEPPTSALSISWHGKHDGA